MQPLPERFARHLATLGLEGRPAVVAVSGGPDSLALLYLLCEVEPRPSLIVAHVDHGIHPDSATVAIAVRDAAASLSLPFESATLALGAGTSETRAREARYRALKAIAKRHRAWLVTAHHRDDQVETVLMRVLKGSGPAGLAGIAPVSGMLVRPLLSFGRQELRDWLASRGVSAWDDPANRDARHLRSWLRTELLPSVRQHVRSFDRRLLSLASQAASDRRGWDAVIELIGLVLQPEGEGFAFDATALRGKPTALVQSVLGAAGRRFGLVIGRRAAGRMATLIEAGRSGRRVPLTGGWEARLDYGRLSVRMAPFVTPEDSTVAIAGESGSAAWDGWQISWRSGIPPEAEPRVTDTAWLEPDTYTVRAWQPGDRIRPLGGTGSRLVVRCMQDVRLPAALRPGWPVVRRGDEVVWVPKVCRAGAALSRGRGVEVTFAAPSLRSG